MHLKTLSLALKQLDGDVDGKIDRFQGLEEGLGTFCYKGRP